LRTGANLTKRVGNHVRVAKKRSKLLDDDLFQFAGGQRWQRALLVTRLHLFGTCVVPIFASMIICPRRHDQAAALAAINQAAQHGESCRLMFVCVGSVGRTVRPTLVVIDDPQTDESARSLSQCATRESILAGAILGLAGPGKKISGIMPCTVIRPGDMADNILSRENAAETSNVVLIASKQSHKLSMLTIWLRRLEY